MPEISSRQGIITLTTDFGMRDQYVGSMKGVILGINSSLRLIDVSHEIPPQDIMAAAWVLRNTAFLYPSGTVHLAVVDPGVGTSRKPLAMKISDQYFVGPDNGLFSLLADPGLGELIAVELTNTSYWYSKRSNTFHGRDIFASVAAHLASGVDIQNLGPKVNEIETYRWALPTSDDEGIQGWIVHIDHYGNLITNIPKNLFKRVTDGFSFKIYVGNTILNNLSKTFASVTEGEPAAIIGSAETLEIVINKGNAEQMLSILKGAPVSVMLKR